MTVAQATAILATGQSKTVTLRLNDTGKRLLEKRGRLEATLTITESKTAVVHKIVTFKPT